jgi:cytidine deaminase
MSADDDALVAAARAARAHAYAPFSEFAVGAALRCVDGTVVTGCNVENASYGLSICAERSAVFAAVAGGRRTFSAIAIAGPDDAVTPPCGACRQVLAQFEPALRVMYTAGAGISVTTLEALLPERFEL